ncbi:MAG: hypothetical protein J4F31_11285 [Flavobacteriales bacterium]|nr:hypothetical protein [Flavobacteriales bacterium]
MIDGKREAFSTGLVVLEKNPSQKRQSIIGHDLFARQALVKLNRLKAKIQNEYDRLNYDNDYSLRRLKNVLCGIEGSTIFFLTEFQAFIEFHQNSEGSSIGLSTLKKYKTIYCHLDRFIRSKYCRKDIPLRELDKAFMY